MLKIFLATLVTTIFSILFVYFNININYPLNDSDIIFSSKNTHTILKSKTNKNFIISYNPVKIKEINKKLMLCQLIDISVDNKKINKKICIDNNQNYLVLDNLDNNVSNRKIKNIDLLKGENILYPSQICKVKYNKKDNIVLLRRDMLKIECSDNYFLFAFGIGLYEVKYNNTVYKFYRQN